MFGLGFGEMVVLGVVLLVVVGPRELPKLLKSLGQGINKLRRMSTDLRKQSGIDDIINEEGLRDDLDAIRSLSKGRLIEGALNAATKPAPKRTQPRRPKPRNTALALEELTLPEDGEAPERDTEYPSLGPDSYGALADDAEPQLPTEPSDDAPPASDPYADADAEFTNTNADADADADTNTNTDADTDADADADADSDADPDAIKTEASA